MARPTVIETYFKAKDGVSSKLDKMQSKMTDVANRFSNAGATAFKVGKQTAIMGAAIAAPLYAAGKAAVDFEDKMADVAKVANVTVGSDMFDKLGDSAKELSMELAISASDAAGLMANLAQGGVAIEDLDRISSLAGRVGVAFGISADLAGESFIKTSNALGTTIEETTSLMDAINHLGNTTAAAAPQILDFMSSGGAAAARAAGASGEFASAFGAQLIAMGTSASEAGTVIERFTKTALMDKDVRRTFDEAGGGAAGMYEVISKGAKLSGAAQDKYFQKFGAYGLKVQLLAKNMESFDDMIQNATQTTITAGSVNKEFENRMSTTGSQIQRLKSQFQVMVIGIGEALLPVVKDLAEELMPVIQNAAKWMKENKPLVATIAKVAAGVAAASFAVSGISFAFLAAQKAAVIFKIAMTALSSPIGMVGAAVVGVGIAINKFVKHYKDYNTIERLGVEARQRAIEKTIDQRLEVEELFSSLRKATKGSDEHLEILRKIDEMSPGLSDKYKLQEGRLRDIEQAEKDLTKSIIERAEAEARAEMLKESMKERIKLEAEYELKKDQGALASFLQGFYDYDNSRHGIEKKLEDAQNREKRLTEMVEKDNAESSTPSSLSASPSTIFNDPKSVFQGMLGSINLNVNGDNIGSLGDLIGSTQSVNPLMPKLGTTQ